MFRQTPSLKSWGFLGYSNATVLTFELLNVSFFLGSEGIGEGSGNRLTLACLICLLCILQTVLVPLWESLFALF